TSPALLFADAPTGNLDYTPGTEILEALWRSCVERHQTIVLVTHDSKAAAYADRVLVISDGRIRDEIVLGRRENHDTAPLISRLAELGLGGAGFDAWPELARPPQPERPARPDAAVGRRDRPGRRRPVRVARDRRRHRRA